MSRTDTDTDGDTAVDVFIKRYSDAAIDFYNGNRPQPDEFDAVKTLANLLNTDAQMNALADLWGVVFSERLRKRHAALRSLPDCRRLPAHEVVQ
jgi:hypothetical protein